MDGACLFRSLCIITTLQVFSENCRVFVPDTLKEGRYVQLFLRTSRHGGSGDPGKRSSQLLYSFVYHASLPPKTGNERGTAVHILSESAAP